VILKVTKPRNGSPKIICKFVFRKGRKLDFEHGRKVDLG
jgi:hypothetical protein